MDKPNTPEPLTKAEEIELEDLFRKCFDCDFDNAPEQINAEIKRYDELRSKQLTYLNYQIIEQVQAERRMALLN